MQLQYGRLLPGNYFRLVTTARKVYVRLSPGCSASSERPDQLSFSHPKLQREGEMLRRRCRFLQKEFDTAFLFEGLYITRYQHQAYSDSSPKLKQGLSLESGFTFFFLHFWEALRVDSTFWEKVTPDSVLRKKSDS